MDLDNLRRDNQGAGAAGNMGNREYIRRMYQDRRDAGMTDPEPANKEAAKFAPPVGVHGGKEHRARNGGI